MNHIVSLVLILLSIGLFFGYVDPRYTSVKELQAKKAQYDTALDNSRLLIQERDNRLAKLAAFPPDDLRNLMKLLPDNIDNIRLIIDISEIAREYGMTIRGFEMNAGQEKQTVGIDTSVYGTVTFSFATTATYEGFLAFVQALERSLRVIDVTNYSFSAANENGIYDFNVTVKTYWLK